MKELQNSLAAFTIERAIRKIFKKIEKSQVKRELMRIKLNYCISFNSFSHIIDINQKNILIEFATYSIEQINLKNKMLNFFEKGIMNSFSNKRVFSTMDII